jgi:hypothetical protein
MRRPTLRQNNQTKKVVIVNYYYQWQISKPSVKGRAKKNLTVSVKTPKGAEEKVTLKGTTGMARLHGSAR